MAALFGRVTNADFGFNIDHPMNQLPARVHSAGLDCSSLIHTPVLCGKTPDSHARLCGKTLPHIGLNDDPPGVLPPNGRILMAYDDHGVSTQRHSLTCRDCAQQALTTERNPNNNALQVVCSACQSRRPLGGRVTNLKQTTTKRRKEYPAGESLEEVWQRFGDRCVVCSAPKEFLIKLAIGRQRQHVAEYAKHGHTGPLVPMCVPCHENATQRQKFFWFLYRAVLQQRENEQPNDEQTTTPDAFEVRP